MKRKHKIFATILALSLALPVYACAEDSALAPPLLDSEQTQPLPPESIQPEQPEVVPEGSTPSTPETDVPEQNLPQVPPPEPEKPKLQSYIRCVGNNVNLRSGAGTSYTVLGQAEKDTMYAVIEHMFFANLIEVRFYFGH